jgi:hypothetical protein
LAELRECLPEVEVDHIGEAKELAMLVIDISGVLMDLGLDPIQWIPQLLRKAQDMLEMVGVILE